MGAFAHACQRGVGKVFSFSFPEINFSKEVFTIQKLISGKDFFPEIKKILI